MADSLDSERVLSVIETVITPYVGQRMARSSSRLHCQKLGIEGDAMTVDQARALVERLARAMRVLIGNDMTAVVEQRMRQILELGEAE